MSRVPGTYEKGDRVKLRHSGEEGTVQYDNRKDGGRNIWIHWDKDRDQVCCDPEHVISVEAGR